MNIFLTTGEFARLCHTTRDTLLHYDRKGLFRPAHVSGNGYRRYGMKQYFDFDLISLLKETGSTLEEIRTCLDAGRHDGYLELFRERIAVLEKEQERIARRLAMLTGLADMGEEALAADYDRLFFEEREAQETLVHPVDPLKITDRESSVECYSEYLMRGLENGDAVEPPLGVIIPEEFAKDGVFRICGLFTAVRNHAGSAGSTRMERGRYACLFHRGTVHGHEQAFGRMMQALADQGLHPRGHVYAYDQMNYVLAEMGEAYIAKYVVRVE